MRTVSRSSSRIRGDREVNMKWITRKDIKVDRVACPWLIKKFVDPQAEFLFVEEKDLVEQARLQDAIPFDAPKIAAIKLNHRGPRCTFEAIIEDYAISDPALQKLSLIVRAADIKGQESVAAEGIGLRSITQGFAAMGLSDEDRLARQLPVYMMLYTHTFKDRESEVASPSRSRPDQRGGLSAFARRGTHGRRVGDLSVSCRVILIHDRARHSGRLGRLSLGNDHRHLCSRPPGAETVSSISLASNWYRRSGLGPVARPRRAFDDGIHRHAEWHRHGSLRFFCPRPSHYSGSCSGFQENMEPGLV